MGKRFLRKHLDLFMEQQQKVLTYAKHEGERKYKEHSLLLFGFHFILEDVRLIHTHLTNVQFSQER